MNPFDELTERFQLPYLGGKLFLIVQRVEFALKRSGITVGSDAMASWKSFGTLLRTAGSDLFAVTRADEVGSVLIKRPPAKLQKDAATGALYWQEQHPPRDSTELMETARDVRNSLFHGEKHIASMRDEELVRGALRVIELSLFSADRLQEENEKLALFVSSLLVEPTTLPRKPAPPR